MKTLSFFIFLSLLFNCALFAQVGINSNGSLPDASAGLDISFPDKGLLVPRMTTSQIIVIIEPAIGLIVYNTTINKPQYFNGTKWNNFDGSCYIGQSYEGGIIFYIDGTGQHGLIAATSDQSTGEWGCYEAVIGGTSTDFGTGQANTTAILNGCSEEGIAASICDQYSVTVDEIAYNDWFLPSKDELNEMFIQRDVIGGFGIFKHWSSSECDLNAAWGQVFSSGGQVCFDKTSTYYVRPARAF